MINDNIKRLSCIFGGLDCYNVCKMDYVHDVFNIIILQFDVKIGLCGINIIFSCHNMSCQCITCSSSR